MILLNRRMLKSFGGLPFQEPDNCLNRGTLDWVLAAVDGKIFETDLYPTVFDKAAAIAWHIATKHVFHDGNKRTAMACCEWFLARNGYWMDFSRESAKRMSLRIVNKQVSFEGFRNWVKRKSRAK